MWNSKKASATIYGIMLALVIIILALALAPPVRDFTRDARNNTVNDTIGMNCSTTTSDFVTAGCYMADISMFAFIGFIIFIAGVIITAKIVFS